MSPDTPPSILNLLKDIHGNELVSQEDSEKKPIAIRMRRRIYLRTPRFTDKRMQRGVQVAMEKKQRPKRLAAVHGYMRLGVERAKELREDYLRRRGKKWKWINDHNTACAAERR